MSRRLGTGALATVAVVVAACGVAAGPPAAGATQAASKTVASSASPSPSSAALPSDSASPAGPPDARLDGLAAGGIAAGLLASFTWDGTGSDGQWIVGPSAGSAPAAADLRVIVGGGLAPVNWQARWAPVAGTTVGSPVDGGSGSSGAIGVRTPATAGAWSLAVTASFGTGRSATWTWRIEVRP
jgi:hypothetical protein